MKALALALIKAGITTDADVKRLESQEKRESRERSERAALELALERLPPTIRLELAAWEEQTRKSVPREVILTWADLPRQLQAREWSRWLAAWRGEKC